MGLNMDQIERGLYIDNNGNVQAYSLTSVLVHELSHALTGRKDNYGFIILDKKYQGELLTDFRYEYFIKPENNFGGKSGEKIRGDHTDYKQPNVTFVNTIYKELGIPQMNSYVAQDTFTEEQGRVLKLGDSYTNGAYIDRSIVLSTSLTPADWDSSALMDKNGNYTKDNTASDLLIGDKRDNMLKSGGGNDWLYGMGGDDNLYGGDGDDKLWGGTGLNHLYGGEGYDEYHIGEGLDIIKDSDKNGVLIWHELDANGALIKNGVQLKDLHPVAGTDNQYVDYLNIKYELIDGSLFIYRPDGGLMARLDDFSFKNNNYGLIVDNSGAVDPNETPDFILPGTNPGTGGDVFHSVTSTSSLPGQTIKFTTGGLHDLITGGNGNEIIDLGSGNDFANGGLGNDIIDGGSGNDVILGSAFVADEAEAGNDVDKLTGGSGRDLIFGGIGNDTIITGTTQYELGESEGWGDWAVGSTGNDTIFGSKDDDFLNGGAGRDTIHGGGGNDIILGDGNIVFGHRTMSQQGVFTSMHTWNFNAGKWNDVHGLTFANFVDPASFNWSAAISNGERPDFSLNAELAIRTDERLAEGGANDIIYGGAGNDWIAGQTGDDYIDGGEGDDIIYGGDVDDTLPDGNDLIYGGAGDDLIFGGKGNDIIYADFAVAEENAALEATTDKLYGAKAMTASTRAAATMNCMVKPMTTDCIRPLTAATFWTAARAATVTILTATQ